jgi:hypothetical protein
MQQENSKTIKANKRNYLDCKLYILLRVQGPPPLVGLGEAQGFAFAFKISKARGFGGLQALPRFCP